MKSSASIFKCLAAGILLYACSEPSDTPKVDTSFESDAVTVTKPATAGQSYSAEIVASDAVSWNAEVTEGNFIELTSRSGKGNGRIMYDLSANEGTAARKGVITVTASCEAESGFSATKTITIQQLGTEPALAVNPSGLQSIGYQAVEAFTIEVVSNVVWTASTNADWISIVSGATGSDNGTVTLSISANETDASRNADIKISADSDPSLSGTVSINQQFKGVTYSIVIPGYSTLSAGASKMKVAGGASSRELDATVIVDAEGTVIQFDSALDEGVWTVESVGGTAVGCLVTIGSAGTVESVETYSKAFGCFGGDFQDRPFKISSEEDLLKLAAEVADSNLFIGKYFKQTADIALTSENWPGIGSTDLKFGGIYDGDGKEVSGLKIVTNDTSNSTADNKALGRGLFNHVRGHASGAAAIMNLTVKGSIEANFGHVGGIVAHVGDSVTVSNCKSYVTVNATCTYSANGAVNSGGIIGWGGGNATLITGCTNYGAVSSGTDISAAGTLANNVGGVMGNISGGTDAYATIEKCVNRGEIKIHGNGGGVVGNVGANVNLKCLANYGYLTSTCTNGRVGGVAGNLGAGTVTLEQSFNAGPITAVQANIGGVAGFALGATVKNCYNSADIVLTSGNNANNGGVVGHKNDAAATITNCYNSGTITATDNKTNFGAIAGTNGSAELCASNVSGCFYESGKGAIKGLAKNNTDIAGTAEAKTADEMKAGAFAGWDTSIWSFATGKYPTLTANPETTE